MRDSIKKPEVRIQLEEENARQAALIKQLKAKLAGDMRFEVTEDQRIAVIVPARRGRRSAFSSATWRAIIQRSSEILELCDHLEASESTSSELIAAE